MREIKFRAWDTEDKVMRSWEELTIEKEKDDESWFIGYPESKVVTRFDHLQTLEQYTGLKDKNGKEIYEGDVVRITNNLQENEIDYNAQIIFKDSGFCAIDGTEDNFGVRRYRLSDFDLELEVIGNIHEHPELME